MKVEYQPYHTRRILNTHQHPDHWFWDKYSAHPYVGCWYGCEYCYFRAEKYLRYTTPEHFSDIIRVKINAPELLHRELSRVPVDVIAIGDYQPAEGQFQLSRRMLEVVRDLGFPAFILEKSPAVVRDLDLIRDINHRSWACVIFTITTLNGRLARILERDAPPPEKRLAAMERFAKAGVLTGTALIPACPYLTDGEEEMAAVIAATRDHGGSFVLAGGLTLNDQQGEWFYNRVLRPHFPHLVEKYQALYADEEALGECYRRVGRTARRLCQEYGLPDRMPRYVPPGELATNKRLAQHLADTSYGMEIEGESPYRVWAYRKAAWAVEELQEDIGQIYERRGREGLESIKGIGKSLAREIEAWLRS